MPTAHASEPQSNQTDGQSQPKPTGFLCALPRESPSGVAAQQPHPNKLTTRNVDPGSKPTPAQALAAHDSFRLPDQLDITVIVAFVAFLLGSATALGTSSIYRRCFKRLASAEWITPNILGRRPWITGVVTRCVRMRREPIPSAVKRPILARAFCFCRHAAWAMRTTFASTIPRALAGVGRSSSGTYPVVLEVRALPRLPQTRRRR